MNLEDFLRGLFRPLLKEVITEEIKELPLGSSVPKEIAEMEVLKHKEYLSAREVQTLYGLNSNTLRSWRGQSRGSAYSRDGDLILYKCTDVEAYLKSNKVRTRDQFGTRG
ncbi:hypothetical protein C4J81_16575 [Deltaproteobacteria bacterium Smac51]|nr:hypothetical protein C4J81_16575 [Deltaproteobacteria bacterium Smac51]